MNHLCENYSSFVAINNCFQESNFSQFSVGNMLIKFCYCGALFWIDELIIAETSC